MAAILIRNPRALMVPELQNLIKRATMAVSFAAPGGFDSIAQDMFKFVTREELFMIIGVEDGKYTGMVLGGFPNLAIFPYPTIFMFYNETGVKALKTLAKKTLDIISEAGYTKAWAVNSSGRPDPVWQRAFTLTGQTELTPMGTVFELRIK